MAGVMKPSPGALRIIDDLEGGLAIVCNGNTAPKNISAGQYLFIKNHSTLQTGGYHATAAISSGGTISSSNVAADADGISNALNSKLTNSLAGQIRYIKFGSMCHVAGPFTGDGTTEIDLGIGNYEGIVMGRNRSTGEMSIYYVGSGKINGWDGHNTRIFTNGTIYQISGIVWQ